jgi:hypothetical protein
VVDRNQAITHFRASSAGRAELLPGLASAGDIDLKGRTPANLPKDMGSLIKKRRKRMRKKKHKKMLKATRWQRRAAGK